MTGLSYAEIVPYELFRDKWRHAIVGIFAFGALFTPPDPFTQIMWAVPLVASRYQPRAVDARDAGPSLRDLGSTWNVARGHWNTISAVQCWAAVWCTTSWRRQHSSTSSSSPKYSRPTVSPATFAAGAVRAAGRADCVLLAAVVGVIGAVAVRYSTS